MKFQLNREAAVVLILFGAMFLANPSLWWLVIPALALLYGTGANRNENNDTVRRIERDDRRSARREDNRPRQQRRQREDNPFREIGEELRRQWEQNVTGPTSRETQEYRNPTLSESRPKRSAAPRETGGALSHALEAVESAGHAPQDLALLPIDVGFIAYTDGERPVRHREAPIPETVNFIQPYIELRLARPAAGTLRFEVLDGAGEVHYVREERHQLKAGRTPIIASTRMPVGDFLYTDSNWSLRVYAAGTLIAEHRFGWTDGSASPSLREHMAEDGELSADLAELIEDARLRPMSIDDLLSDQPASQTARRK